MAGASGPAGRRNRTGNGPAQDRQRIDLLERPIRRLEWHRSLAAQEREKRDVFQAALVVTPTAANSTLLNQLTGADAYRPMPCSSPPGS